MILQYKIEYTSIYTMAYSYFSKQITRDIDRLTNTIDNGSNDIKYEQYYQSMYFNSIYNIIITNTNLVIDIGQLVTVYAVEYCIFCYRIGLFNKGICYVCKILNDEDYQCCIITCKFRGKLRWIQYNSSIFIVSTCIKHSSKQTSSDRKIICFNCTRSATRIKLIKKGNIIEYIPYCMICVRTGKIASVIYNSNIYLYEYEVTNKERDIRACLLYRYTMQYYSS